MFCGGMELRLHLKLFKDDTTFCDVCGTCRFFGDARGHQCSFLLCLHPQGCLRRAVWASGSPQVWTGKSGSFSMLQHQQGKSRFGCYQTWHQFELYLTFVNMRMLFNLSGFSFFNLSNGNDSNTHSSCMHAVVKNQFA